jgi:cyclopropane-fatty-acyl-phospholipid synthase
MMNDSSIVPVRTTSKSAGDGIFAGMWRKAVLKRLAGLTNGSLTVIEADDYHHFGDPVASDLHATLRITDSRTWAEIALGGANGAAEAWIMGWWQSDDLTALVRVLCRNKSVLRGVDGGMAWFTRVGRSVAHWFHSNGRSAARKHIHAHYDLGNDFFQLFLDETMSYSSAIYPTAEASLLEAQLVKIDRLCKKLSLRPDQHLLEIGTGWGALAIHAARNYGCQVTTTTISQEQFDLATERVRAAGLEDQITVLFKDYRDLDGSYDRIVSVEMIEAIGHRHYGTFFNNVDRLLTDDGLAVIQAITIADQEFDRAKRSVDFIKRYIFPGSCIPSVTALTDAMTHSSSCSLVDMEDITPHYARTLSEWQQRFDEQIDSVKNLGYDEHFIRMWRYYLSYCEGGFAERSIGNIQIAVAKPGWRSRVQQQADAA